MNPHHKLLKKKKQKKKLRPKHEQFSNLPVQEIWWGQVWKMNVTLKETFTFQQKCIYVLYINVLKYVII